MFDPRPAPLGAPYGTRISVLVVAMTASMLLGAGLALKDTVFYTAYDVAGRLWALDALADERLGGLIVWIPGSAACVPAFLVLLRMSGSREARTDERRRRGFAPTVVTSGNHRIASLLALAAFTAFAVTIGVGVISMGHAAH